MPEIPSHMAESAYMYTQVGERVELPTKRSLPGHTTGVWVGNDKPGRRMCGPTAPQCDLGLGFGSTWQTKRMVSTETFDGDGVLDSSKVKGWRSSAATESIANPNRDGNCKVSAQVQVPAYGLTLKSFGQLFKLASVFGMSDFASGLRLPESTSVLEAHLANEIKVVKHTRDFALARAKVDEKYGRELNALNTKF
eukprot:gene18293-27138_t